MSRDYPTLDEQYGPGAEQADAEAQDDVATELQEAIDSPSEYNHRYWTEIAGRAVEKLQRREARIAELETALHEIADFSEQFIADDEDGDERMYKVNQIADTALALDRRDEHGP